MENRKNVTPAARLLILEISADVANHVCKIQYVRDRVAHMKETRQRDFDYYIRLDMYVRHLIKFLGQFRPVSKENITRLVTAHQNNVRVLCQRQR